MRALVACVVSFALAFVAGMFVLHRAAPPNKPGPKALKHQAQDPPTLEMLPALPSFRAARTEGPSNQQVIEGPAAAGPLRTQDPRAGTPSRAAIGAQRTRLAVSRRGHTAGHPPAAIGQRIPSVTSGEKPRRVSKPTVVANVPASAVSGPPATPTTRPPVIAPARDTRTAAASPRPQRVPVTRPIPDTAQTPKPDVTQGTPPASAVPEAYVLGPGDQIEVNVPHLAATVTIKPDGLIALPLISEIKAAGKTTAQLASDLKTVYSRFLDAPSVTVFVLQYRMNH